MRGLFAAKRAAAVLATVCWAWLTVFGTTATANGQSWTVHGKGTAGAEVDDDTGNVALHYAFEGNDVFDGETWRFETTASVTGTIYYDWSYSGNHAWFMTHATLTAFATGPGGSYREYVLFDGAVGGDFAKTGSLRLPVFEGYRYGFLVYGKNFDSSHFLRGTIALSPEARVSVVPVVTGEPGSDGWYRSDVGVSWNVSTSPPAGIVSRSGCEPTFVRSDTPGTPFVCTAETNRHSASGSVTIKRDATPPTIVGTVYGAANANGWYNAPVEVRFACGDAMSQIASCAAPVRLTGEGEALAATGTASDRAGNVSSATVSGIRIDATPPVIYADMSVTANAYGWFREPVTVRFRCEDALSGPASCGPAAATFDAEGAGQSVTAAAYDAAGNAAVRVVDGIRIDRTAPAMSVRFESDKGELRLSGTDGLSGLQATYYALDGGPVRAGDTIALSLPGAHTIAYWSEDKAGNVESPRTLAYADLNGDGRCDIADVVLAVTAELDATGDGAFTHEDAALWLQAAIAFGGE
ncbi:OmpL47-type beta-barrel domain-containing protein [Paenibacillus sp. GYB003]|uniref:OmpL47-type beta-barrel domain-containing protein n=1 Tax=Paenibacillus sp. GYB003 TaxID=2994392 RepID=UPI002F965E2B